MITATQIVYNYSTLFKCSVLSLTESQYESEINMVTTLEQLHWYGHSLQKQTLDSGDGNSVPFNCIKPQKYNEPLPVIIALHGVTSSKHEWTEMDGYTKGGNLTRELVENQMAVLAVDLHYHGDNATRDMGNLNILDARNWEDFFTRSIKDIQAIISHIALKPPFDPKRLGLMGYSMGGLFGFWLANRTDWFKVMSVCVPPVDQNKNDEYTTFGNLENLKDLSLIQVSARKDEYIPFENSISLFEKIPLAEKKFLSYESGHSLPYDYVPEVVNWFKGWL